MMIRKLMPVLAILGSVALSAGSCERQDPCRFLAPPSTAEQAAAAGGAEVERPGEGDAECLVVGNRWSVEAPE